MTFGLTLEKLIVIGVVVGFFIGPERLPAAAGALRRGIRSLTTFLRDARERAVEELGVDDDIDWTKLDPRRYDPRRIIREALIDDAGPPRPSAGRAAASMSAAEISDDTGAPPVGDALEAEGRPL